MIDMTDTIIPKSDQLNSDDLLGRTLTIKITDVSRCKEPEQPIAISFEGDGGKPWKPGKSMRRVLVNVWGPDGAAYVGRSLTLYRDDEVLFGGVKVGGIRISNMSHITKNVTMALTASRASRKPFQVAPLKEVAPPVPPKPTISEWLDATEVRFKAAQTPDEVAAIVTEEFTQKALASLKNGAKTRLDAMIKEAMDRTSPADGEGELPPVENAPEDMLERM